MSITIELQIENDYVNLHCTGHCSLAALKEVFTHAVDAALEHKKSKVLVEGNEVTGHLSTLERYKIAEFLAQEINQRARGKIRKLAVCAQEPLLDPQRFGETVAMNRGVNAKATTDLNEATRWLLQ